MSRFAPTLLVGLAMAVTILSAREAEACTCLPSPGIEHVYANAKHVVRVNIRKEVRRIHRIPGVPTLDGTIRVYRAKVKQSYKGCIRRGRILKLVTASDSGLCGVTLDRRQEYVIALGEGDRKAFEINSCGFIRQTDSLSAHEREFLDTRHQCCNGRCGCTGSDAVSCLVDPCSVESCGDAACEANFCGGCTAEFSTPNGQPVCTPCQNAFDCGPGQTCSGGQCIPDAPCGTDGDCSADTWCRPTEASGSECVPFVGEGESCEGFTVPWAFERCAPGLECLPALGIPETPDLPGICGASIP